MNKDKVQYKSNVIFKNGEYLNAGIRVNAAATKKIIIELNDTSLHNLSIIAYSTKHIKNIYILVINKIPNVDATAFPPLKLAKHV